MSPPHQATLTCIPLNSTRVIRRLFKRREWNLLLCTPNAKSWHLLRTVCLLQQLTMLCQILPACTTVKTLWMFFHWPLTSSEKKRTQQMDKQCCTQLYNAVLVQNWGRIMRKVKNIGRYWDSLWWVTCIHDTFRWLILSWLTLRLTYIFQCVNITTLCSNWAFMIHDHSHFNTILHIPVL